MILTATIQRGLNIYDYSNVLLGGFDNIILGMMTLNPQLVNLNVDLSDFATQDITYDDAYYVDRSPQIQLPITSPPSNVYSIQCRSDQSLYDINLQGYSGFDNMVQFMVDNHINSTNNQSVSGVLATFNKNQNSDLSTRAVIEKKGYVFATLFSDPSMYRITDDGFFRITDDGFFRII